MRVRIQVRLRVWSVFLLLALLLSTVGMSSIFAQADGKQAGSLHGEDPGGDSPPTPVEPAGTYSTNSLTYVWTVVTGATNYRYRVWDGATKMWDQVVTSSACDSTYCTHFPPTLKLIDGAYKWQVQAKKEGTWTDWSDLKWYSIKAGFNSQFTTDAAGWQPTYGAWTWDLYNGNYRTDGIFNKWSTARFDQVYSVYTYEVKLRRQGANMISPYGVMINGSQWPLFPMKEWNKGYGFYITRDGEYGIWRYDSDHVTTIVGLTPSSAIKSGWYNTLKVTYNADSGYAQFFINGTRVYDGTLNTYKWGNVGITMLKTSAGWEQLLVDWAKLEITAPSSAAEAVNTDVINVDEAAALQGSGDDTGH